ncbi:DUF2182 domain-containing protein [Rhodococcus sp. NPDC058514]|uniref:DUF2182 domain-containing protein n=1 Tax=unclassified Rhodococcus (in: high G+C Gram-positive bacteria) TaxID=192944 RepID=UPI00366943F4
MSLGGTGPGVRASLPQSDPIASLSRRVLVVVTAWLLAGAAVGWVLVARNSAGMSGMVSGLAEVGTGMPMPIGVPAFLAMWVAMMVAMMFPTAVPLVAAHHVVVRRRGEGIAPTVALVGGYLLVWAVAGLVPLAALAAFRRLADSSGDSRWLPVAAGLALVVAGAYQFTRWKSVCLRTCRSPFAFLMEHDFGGGSPAALRAGIVHGGYCLGCCWALMSVLLVVGLMNLVWMLALTLVFLAEKCWRHGWFLPRVVGTALVAVGVSVMIQPVLLQVISGVTGGGMTDM